MTAVLVAGLAVGAAPAWPVQSTELEQAERAREAAEAEQAEGLRRLDELTAEIAAGSEELVRLGAELETIRRDAETAAGAIPRLQAESEAARQRVAEGEGRVAEVEAQLASHNAALAQWAIHMFKRGKGPSLGPDLIATLSTDESSIFVQRLPYLEALAFADAERREEAASVAAVVQAAHAEVERLRDAAEEQEARAVAAVEQSGRLEARQQQTIAAAIAEQDRRAALLLTLEADNAAHAALLRKLAMQTATLSQRLAVQAGAGVPAWAAALPPKGRPWAEALLTTSVGVEIDARLLAAVAWTESNFRTEAVSPVGAIGLCQLMPATAAGLGVNPHDPEQNLLGGARYLRQLLDRYPDNPEYAIAAYNAGPGRVDDAGGIPAITETQLYVTRVLEHYDQLAAVGA